MGLTPSPVPAGYWVSNPTELNPRFGTADDLKYLIAEVHKRGMYIMVDIGLSRAALRRFGFSR